MSKKKNKKELEKIKNKDNLVESKPNIMKNENLDKTIYVKDLSSGIKKYNKKKKTKKILIISLSILLILLIISLIYYLDKDHKEQIRLDNIKKEQEMISNIKSHYNNIVKTNKESNIYNSNEEIIGVIGNNVSLSLDDTLINKDTKYFKVKDFEDTYIEYNDVEKIDSLTIYDNRYKSYIVFNENIITKDTTSFYDKDNNLIYKFNNTFYLPIIIKEDNKYGVEFNNRLLYINSDDVVETKYNYNTDIKNSTGVPVLNYHFVYEDDDNSCNEIICHSATQIKSQFSYIKDNDYFTPKLSELEMYIDGKIQLPQKSVVLTFDDGGRAEVAKKYVDMYELNATLFLITGWFDKEQFESKYFEVHSHGDKLHYGGECPGGQGGEIKCMEHDKLLADLKLSREKLNGSTYFCYPFYEYNNYSISVLKEAGYTMAFAGAYANGYARVKVGADKFRLPRHVIVSNTSLDYFKYLIA